LDSKKVFIGYNLQSNTIKAGGLNMNMGEEKNSLKWELTIIKEWSAECSSK
jgi:hypothetical protein